MKRPETDKDRRILRNFIRRAKRDGLIKSRGGGWFDVETKQHGTYKARGMWEAADIARVCNKERFRKIWFKWDDMPPA